MKDLENFGVQELNASEIRETNGGHFVELVGWVYSTIARYHHRGGLRTQYGL